MTTRIYNRLIKRLFSLPGEHAFAIILFIFCTASTLTANAQATVQGRVTDENGKPVTSASVTVRGTSRGTATNENGEFKIQATRADVLIVSFVGFADKEVRIGSESYINVALTSNNSQLEQVIVVGYGTQKRANVTGAISTVS